VACWKRRNGRIFDGGEGLRGEIQEKEKTRPKIGKQKRKARKGEVSRMSWKDHHNVVPSTSSLRKGMAKERGRRGKKGGQGKKGKREAGPKRFGTKVEKKEGILSVAKSMSLTEGCKKEGCEGGTRNASMVKGRRGFGDHRHGYSMEVKTLKNFSPCVTPRSQPCGKVVWLGRWGFCLPITRKKKKEGCSAKK